MGFIDDMKSDSMKKINIQKLERCKSILFKVLAYSMGFLGCPFASHGKVYVNIGSAKAKKSALAISPFVIKKGAVSKDYILLSQRLYSQFSSNLEFSGYFTIISPKAFIEDPTQKKPVPHSEDSQGFRWENWKLIGADLLLFVELFFTEDTLKFSIFLYDIHLQKPYFIRTYSSSLLDQGKNLINKISNDIVRRLSGRDGIFLTKILSIRSMEGSKKELFIMDWNGQNKKQLTWHRSFVVSPIWSPKGDRIAYTAFVFNKKLKKRTATLFLMNRKTKVAQILFNRRGANLGADFFPNGTEMLITLTEGLGFMNIFKLHLKTKTLTSLTHGPWKAINVEPSIHPKTERVAFSSDRSGKTMIYTMNKRGENIRQLTYAGHHNASPDWSPVKRELVFAGQAEGRFDIFLINETGGGFKRLTTLRKKNGEWANFESPNFSPDGRFLVFTSDFTGNYQLYIMNLDDLSMERITFDSHNYKSPRWSPYL